MMVCVPVGYNRKKKHPACGLIGEVLHLEMRVQIDIIAVY